MVMVEEVDLHLLEEWLKIDAEDENLEFKAATRTFQRDDLVRYSVALANEGGGYLVLGVTNQHPREVLGTRAFASKNDINDIKYFAHQQAHGDIKVTELRHAGGRVLVITVPSRPIGVPLRVGTTGEYLCRSGESVTGMSDARMRAIFAETESDWLSGRATAEISAEKILELLDLDALFRLLGGPILSTPAASCGRLINLELIVQSRSGFAITNLGALVAARTLSGISVEFGRRSPRFIIYERRDKLITKSEPKLDRGYAVGFEELVMKVYESAPQNRLVEQLISTPMNVYPLQSLRELIANALIHQDFSVLGSRVMIQMYEDRVEISNPGTPPIDIDRFIDDSRSRNAVLADLMRKAGICEEKGSGIDKVVAAAESHQLPAPEFHKSDSSTTAVLFGPKPFSEMTQLDRIRACYQHCCLLSIARQPMSNQSLRKRFDLSDNKSTIATTIITDTKNAGLIKLQPSDSTSPRFTRYIPYWA